MKRDWSDVPPEILQLICKKLPDIYDFVVFRAVCKTWRSCECNPPIQLPWILEHRKYPDNSVLCFYSLFSGKILTITCAGSCNKCFLGPSNYYLLAYNHTEVGFSWSLFNPLTNNDIDMPPLEEGLMYRVEWIGPDPTGYGEHVVYSRYDFTSLCSCTKISWRFEDHDTVSFRLQGLNVDGKLYRKGEYFFVDGLTGVTKVTNITTQKLVYELPPIFDLSRYYWKFWIVESGEGEEILLLRKMLGTDQVYFDIYQLDLKSGKGNASWVEVNSIGEQVLFLDEHRGLSFCTGDYKGLGENCIYLLEGDLLYKYDIKDGTTENLYCPFVGCNKTWFTPRPY